ncbi:MAG: glycosyltransferase [Pyrinomonadaceae bacterium]
MMKIIRIIARLNVGGPARHVVWLTQDLQDDEFDSLLVAGRVPPGEKDMSYVADASGVQPVYIEEMSRELSLADAVSLIKVFRLLLREKPDIVHTHTAKAGTVGRSAAFLYRWLTPGALIGRPRRLAVVHTFHGHVFHSYYSTAKTSLFIMIEKLLARFVTDKIIVIADQQFEEIHQQVGIGKAEQFELVPLGIDLEPFAQPELRRGAFREACGVGANAVIIGLVGRLTEIKNIRLYLAVAQHFAATTPPDIPPLHFVIAGDGHLRAVLEADAADLDNITFLGNRKDIETIYAGLDIVALTSSNEGTPLSLIEGMASRRPVISTAVGGVVDLLGRQVEEHSGFSVCERGIAVDPGNADAFVKGLIYLVKNERLRGELSNNGYDFVLKNYDKGRLANDLRQVYRGLSRGGD